MARDTAVNTDHARLARMSGVRMAVLTEGRVSEAWGAWESVDEVVGHPFPDLLDPDDRDAFREAEARSARGEEVFVAGLRTGARLVWRLTRGSAPDSLLVCGRSDAAEVTLRDKLSRLEATLWKGLPFQNLGYATAGIVHDFNNLLTPVVASADELSLGIGLDDPLRRHVETLLEAVEQAASLTCHLVSSPPGSDAVRGTDLGEVLEAMQPLLRQALEPAHLLALDLPEDPPCVAVAADRVFQVVMNLVLNARQAMRGGGVIGVLLDQIDNGRPWARLRVVDDGVGMDGATLARVFEPRFSTRRTGAGLGLPLVRDIVDMAQGRLIIQSTEGSGTCVEVLLPLGEPARDTAPQTPPAYAAGQGDETILLVDDNPGIRRMVQRILKRAGYFTMVASTGDEAVMRMIGFPGAVDLVILDVGLPDRLSGPLATELLRRHPETAILYVSGYPRDAVPDGAFHRPGAPFLAKPFSGRALLSSIRTALVFHQACREATASP